MKSSNITLIIIAGLFLYSCSDQNTNKQTDYGQVQSVEAPSSSCSFQADGGTEAQCNNSEQLNLLAATDFDYATPTIRRSLYSSYALRTSINRVNPTGSTRNNTFQSMSFGWRLSTDAVTVRRAANTFGSGAAVTSALNLNALTGTFTFNPSRVAAPGTYYFYFTFVTRGEDRTTLIWKAVLQ